MKVMTGWQKLAVILESWKRIPQDFDYQTQKLVHFINDCPFDAEKSALVWMLSRNLRARPVDMTFLLKVFFNNSSLPGWMVEQSFLVNADKAEALAQLVPDKETDISIHEVLNVYQQLKIRDAVQKEMKISYIWQHTGLQGRWLFNRLITGSYLCPLHEDVLPAALSAVSGLPGYILKHRLCELDSYAFHWSDLLRQTTANGLVPRPLKEIKKIRLSELENQEGRHFDCLYIADHWQRGLLMIGPNSTCLFAESLHALCTVNDAPKLTKEVTFCDVFYDDRTAPDYQIYTHNSMSDHPLFEGENKPSGNEPPCMTLSDQTISLTLNTLPTMPVNTASWSITRFADHNILLISRALSSPNTPEVYLLMPERFVANAMLMYVKRHAHAAGQWEEITLGMKHHDFADLVPVARWHPPDEWLHTDAWKAGIKQLMGDKFGPVTTILPGWQVQIAFDTIALSRKTKSGFTIPRCEILNGQLNPSTDETDNICDLYQYWKSATNGC